MAILTCSALVALDATVVATAVPSIVQDLGGFEQFPWLFSIYLLAQAVTVPVYGRLADVWGRKPVLLVGIAIFGVASVLCAIAWSMPLLIAARCLQGLGAGAIQPISQTLVGDLYTLEERAKMQGYLASVWAMSSVSGPVIGGLLSDYASWRLIFAINVPLCLLASILLIRRLREPPRTGRSHIDILGGVLVTAGLAVAILALLEGGLAWPWLSVFGIGLPLAGIVILAVFILVESRVREPLIPLWVFSRRRLASSSAMSAYVGAMMLGLATYIPTYAHSVLGVGSVVAGLALASMFIGWPIAATTAGWIYLAYGFRRCCALGAGFALCGALIIATLQPTSSIWQVTAGCVVIGLGMGWIGTPSLVAAQMSVGWERRGIVTAMNLFFRTIGSAVGVAVLGALSNAGMRSAAEGSDDATVIFAGSGWVFRAVVVIAVAMIFTVWAMPNDAPRRRVVS